MKTRTLLFSLALILACVAQGELIPAVRLTNWEVGVTVGVQGGIPTGRTQYANAVTEGADNTGATDATTIINTLLAACPAGQYVYLPAGTYSHTGIGGNLNNVTLRGAGMGQTILRLESPSTIGMAFGSESDYTWSEPIEDTTLTATPSQGDSVISIADTTNFTVGQLCRIAWDNMTDDAALEAGAVPVLQTNGDTRPVRKQMVKITAKTSTTLTFTPPICHAPQAGVAAEIKHARIISQGVGVEDLTLDCTNTAATFAVRFTQAMNCWVKNVEVKKANNYTFYTADCLFMEMGQSYANEGKPGGSNGAGFLIVNTSGSLFEDNIAYKCFPSFEINEGCTGNVFAYNLSEGTASTPATFNINHGPHNSHNLYEGNIAPTFQSDGYFGGSSEDTFHRNYISGTNSAVEYHAPIVSLNRWTRNASLTGNILGNPAWPHGSDPYSFGNPNLGNGAYAGTQQMSEGDFAIDWKMTGVLTTRTNDTTGVITLDSGSLATAQFRAYWEHTGTRGEIVSPVVLTGGMMVNDIETTFAGGTVSFTSDATLPAQGQTLNISAGIQGFQELDLDVEATAVRKANYHNWGAGGNAIPAGQELGGDTLPNSLYTTEAEAVARGVSWGSLDFPPFDPFTPATASYERLPAARRYLGLDTAAAAKRARVGGKGLRVDGMAVKVTGNN
jgi:hypothetical protein